MVGECWNNFRETGPVQPAPGAGFGRNLTGNVESHSVPAVGHLVRRRQAMQRRSLKKASMITERDITRQRVKHRRRRNIVLGLVTLALVAVVLYGPALREQEPDYYNPARTAIVNARLQLEESLGHEKALNEQLQMVHEELDSAITQLGKAADLDPADRARIEALRSSLMSIERPDASLEQSSNELYQSYSDLLSQMDVLIAELDNRTR